MRLRNVRGSRDLIAKSPYVIKEPERYRGRWKEFYGDGRPLHIEIGMGKGKFLMELARENPEIHYIGIEKFSSVLVRAIEKMEEAPLENVHFLRMDAEGITNCFGPGEVAKIYLNFSDPWPKERHVKRRLTSLPFLKRYGRIMTAGASLVFKTDNRDLFTFSLKTVPEAGWFLEEQTFDLHHSEYKEGNIMTEYEERFVEKGVPICMMKIHPSYLLASDLDGTMMRNNSRLSDYTKEVLRKAIQHGVEFLPTSGRSYRAAYDAIKDIEGIRYFLGGNASVITDVRTEEILRQWTISTETAYQIYRLILDMGGYVEMYCENDVYVDEGRIPVAYQSKLSKSLIDSLLETVIRVPSMDLMIRRGIMQVNKMHIIFPDSAQRLELAEKIYCFDEVQCAYPTVNNMEIFPSACNKDIGMEYIRELLNIEPENTIAMGDSNNDKAMVEYAALGIAVGNAMEELKEAADLVVESNEEDGPARFIEARFLTD